MRSIPGVTVHGPGVGGRRRAPTVSITLAGAPAEVVARRLGERGIQVWDGDFYAVRAVEVLGLAGVGGLLRTGFLLYNTQRRARPAAGRPGRDRGDYQVGSPAQADLRRPGAM